MSDRRKIKDGSVGPGRPPKHSQFKPGQSGNPKGRPKGKKLDVASLDWGGIMIGQLVEMIEYMENGKQTKSRRLDVIFKHSILKAMKGDMKPLVAAVKLFGIDFVTAQMKEMSDPLDSPEDIETRDSLLRRLRGKS